MKKIIYSLVATFLLALTSFAQLGSGALAFVQFNTASNQTNKISFVVREPIPSGTVVYVTNRDWSNASNGFVAATANQGTLTLTFNEQVSVGQIIAISFTAGATPNPSSTIGAVTANGAFDFGPGNDIDNVFIYQSGVSGTSFLTAAA